MRLHVDGEQAWQSHAATPVSRLTLPVTSRMSGRKKNKKITVTPSSDGADERMRSDARRTIRTKEPRTSEKVTERWAEAWSIFYTRFILKGTYLRSAFTCADTHARTDVGIKDVETISQAPSPLIEVIDAVH